MSKSSKINVFRGKEHDVKSKFNTGRTKGADMKCQHPFPVPNAIGNTNLWRFFMPCWGHPKLYEYGWEIPCFFACGRRK